MSRFSRVERKMWRDEKFRSLSAPAPNAQTLWQYLLTGPHNTVIPGLFVLGMGTLAEELNWPLEATRECFYELTAAGMVRFDAVTRLMWLPNSMKYNPPANPNIVAGWKEDWALLPDCSLRSEAGESLGRSLVALSPALGIAFDKAQGKAVKRKSNNPSGLPKPNRLANRLVPVSPQEKEKEKEKEDPPNPPPIPEGTERGKASCTDVEHPNALDHDAVLDALLRSSDGKIDIRGPAQLKTKFVAVINEANWTLEELGSLGRYIAAGKVAWAHRKRFDLAWLLGHDGTGARLTELMASAIERDHEHRLLEADRARAAARDQKPWSADTPAMRIVRAQLAQEGSLSTDDTKAGVLH